MSSIRGAPGVSCWSMMLAAAWRHSADRVLVEADGSGGVVAARYNVASEPGAADLLSAGRRGRFGPASTESMAQLLRPSTDTESALWVVPTPLLGHKSHALWSALARPAAAAMTADPRLWVADCGRVWPGAPSEQLLLASNLNVVVTDSSVESLVVLQSRVQSLPQPIAMIVVGKTNHSEEELLNFTSANYLWKVPHVSELGNLVAGFTALPRRGHRSKIWRRAVAIAGELADITRSIPGPAVRSESPPPHTELSPGPMPPPEPPTSSDASDHTTSNGTEQPTPIAPPPATPAAEQRPDISESAS